MNKTNSIKNPSSLVAAVLALDGHFSDLQRLSTRIENIDMKSDADVKQGERLLMDFTESGLAVGDSIKAFVEILNESRTQAELSAQKVAEKAAQLRIRKDDVQGKLDQFEALNNKVSQLNETLLGFRRPAGEELTEADRADLRSKLSEVAGKLDGYIAEAQSFQELGHQANIKVLQQNADSMKQSLIAVSKKLHGMVEMSSSL